jgi:hypothetical protein
MRIDTNKGLSLACIPANSLLSLVTAWRFVILSYSRPFAVVSKAWRSFAVVKKNFRRTSLAGRGFFLSKRRHLARV